jgi:hypothetical protein
VCSELTQEKQDWEVGHGVSLPHLCFTKALKLTGRKSVNEIERKEHLVAQAFALTK